MLRARRILVPMFLITTGMLVVACNPGANPSIVRGAGGGTPAIGISGDSMHRLAANTSRWSPGIKEKRRCDGSFWCDLGTKKVEIEIFADVDAKNYGPSTSSTGVLVGKLVNLGDAKEEMYGLANGGYDYLLWVVPGGTNPDTGRFVIVQVDTNPPHKAVTVASGIQIGCKHDTTWTKSFAVFTSCADGPPPGPRVVRDDRLTTGLPVRRAGFFSFAGILGLQLTHEAPAWVTCTSGCCTSGQPQ